MSPANEALLYVPMGKYHVANCTTARSVCMGNSEIKFDRINTFHEYVFERLSLDS